ncbi:IS3 family transposase, partial [Streptococcus iniae]|uniref:IS3 family transposase n=1 Tax=Streptococcus iniae TaxID=1346 RepID=UPI00115CFA52
MKYHYSITALCHYFSFPRSSYYLWVTSDRPLYKAFDKQLVQPITEIVTEHPKGYRYVCNQLRRHYNISRNNKTILRYMRILGLRSPIRQKKYHSCTQGEINEKARHVHYNVLAQN